MPQVPIRKPQFRSSQKALKRWKLVKPDLVFLGDRSYRLLSSSHPSKHTHSAIPLRVSDNADTYWAEHKAHHVSTKLSPGSIRLHHHLSLQKITIFPKSQKLWFHFQCRRCSPEPPPASDPRLSTTAIPPRHLNRKPHTTELLDLNKIERHDYNILLRLKLSLNRYGPSVPTVGSSSDSAASCTNSAEVKKEKTAYVIKLEKFDAAARIKIIKELRMFMDLGLKEAKELVEKAPVVLKKGITKEEATAIADELKELGATVTLEE